MRLVACQSCRAQYDVTSIVAKEIECRCGEPVEVRDLVGVDATIRRCGSCGAHVSAEAEACDYCGSSIAKDAASLSLICPECYGRNAEDSRFCTACGVSFDPQSLSVEGDELPCPVCGGLMPVRAVGEIGVNECSECNGLWVPENRFGLLVNRAIDARRKSDPGLLGLTPRVQGSNPARQTVQYRKCPVCEAFMQRRNFRKRSGVIIDRCYEHGTWLDADELEQIAGFLMGSDDPAARSSVAELEHEERKTRVAAEFTRQGAKRLPERQTDDGVVSTLIDLFGALFK